MSDDAAAARTGRAGLVESLLDPVTHLLMRESGVTAGWHCLEIGVGHGSIARWLADHIGPDGRVVALDTDIDVVGDTPPNMEVIEGDIATIDVAERFDLVHCRAVLEHIEHGHGLVPKLIDMLEPGGHLVVEEFTWVGSLGDGFHMAPELEHLGRAIMESHALGKHEFLWEGWLPVLLEDSGLRDVRADLRLPWRAPADPSHPDALMRSIERRRKSLMATGRVTAHELDRIESGLTESWHCFGLVCARGRKP